MPVLVITGTGTEVGKTVTTAAVAATALAAGRTVAVLKAAQTGVGPDEAGDADEVARLVRRHARLHGLQHGDPLAAVARPRRERCGDHGLAHLRVRSRDDQAAHATIASVMRARSSSGVT